MNHLDLTQFIEPGLYLVPSEGEAIVLTRKVIDESARALLNDPQKLTPSMRAAADYQPCDICPERDTSEICHAILPTLPFLDEIDRYMSYDRVTAVYREPDTEILMIRETSMQEALQYVTILSLMYYCEVGRQYYSFFHSVNPLMPQIDIATAVFHNMYHDCEGDLQRLAKTLKTMQEELLQTTWCQVKRLRLISQGDAFLNAFVSAQTTTELMLMEVAARLRGMQGPLRRPGDDR
ncbi:MAG: hypothetical protein HQ523_06580 [Lentisphaerae bacterium]|nr:hypothetical protein [Lentisphaerota bacterium]